MLKINKSTNISGQSFVDVTEGIETTTKQVAYMNATISDEDSNVRINKAIQDKDLFAANKEAVVADFSEFENYVYGLLG